MPLPDVVRAVRWNPDAARLEWERSSGVWVPVVVTGSGSSPTGPAGGDLNGTYPNPTVRALTETSGPTRLVYDSIADGTILTRDGTLVLGWSLGDHMLVAYPTDGAILVHDPVSGWIELIPNTAGYVLTDNGPGLAPSWQAASGGSGLSHGGVKRRLLSLG